MLGFERPGHGQRSGQCVQAGKVALRVGAIEPVEDSCVMQLLLKHSFCAGMVSARFLMKACSGKPAVPLSPEDFNDLVREHEEWVRGLFRARLRDWTAAEIHGRCAFGPRFPRTSRGGRALGSFHGVIGPSSDSDRSGRCR